MARINIEDSLWADDRFLALVEKISNRAAAVGAVVLAFRMAQKFWIPDKRPIPSVQFRSLPFASELISCGLAEEDPFNAVVVVKGSEEQFSWLLQRSRAGAKSKGKTRNGIKRDRTEANGSITSSSSSSSSSSSNSKKQERPSGGVPALPEQPLGLGRSNPASRELSQSPQVIAAYVESYQKRYPGARPEITGKVQGQIRTLLKEMPLQRAINMVQVYCQMDDPWFDKKHHDFGTFMENLNKVRFALDTGADASEHAPVDFVAMIKESEAQRDARRV